MSHEPTTTGTLRGGVHGSALPPEEWAAIEALYGRVWQGMPARLRQAETLGARWADHTTPFTWFEGGRALAVVGVLEHPVILDGRELVIGGIHSVGTDPAHRGRGLCRRLLAAAVAWAESRYPILKLSTSSPDVFRSSGFRSVPTHAFVVPAAPAAEPVMTRVLDLAHPADLERLHRVLGNRAPVSRVYATRDPGWLTLIDAALGRLTTTWFHEVPAAGAVLVGERHEGGWIVHDLLCERLPEHLPPLDGNVTLRFTPDLLAPDARPIPAPDMGLMVRGPWPDLPPFGVPALWEH